MQTAAQVAKALDHPKVVINYRVSEMLTLFGKDNPLPRLEISIHGGNWDKMKSQGHPSYKSDQHFPQDVDFEEPADKAEKDEIFKSFPETQ